MRLNEEEYNKYLGVHPKLIYYVGMRKKLIPKETSLEEFMNYTVEDKYPIRNAMYENIHMLNDYIKENSERLSEEEKEIIRDFKYFKQGTFYVVKLTKKVITYHSQRDW